jgi:serine/threonine protein kinase
VKEMTQAIADYEILSTLGRNSSGGRITYLAQKGDRKVVIKQFQFATSGSDWSGWKALEREVDILKGLQHPKIPQYIESLELDSGFCLVQEYIPAESLGVQRPRSLEQIKGIGRQVLEILVYLQELHPVVLHRDIKPENILCNDQGEVFLVDFGFSRLGAEDVGASSMMVGTIGFIPPELFGGREPSKASDLYSLGATLICLITGTPTYKMSDLIDDFAFSERAFEGLDHQYANWLKKMVSVRVSDRFADAAAALDGLKRFDEKEVSTIHRYEESKSTKHSEYAPTFSKIKARKTEFRLQREVEIARMRHQRNPSSAVLEHVYNEALDKHISFVNGYEIISEKRSHEPKVWRLYAGYFGFIVLAYGIFSSVIVPALTSISILHSTPPTQKCCTSNPCTSLQKWGCENGIPYP